jgi:hypothetical protein
MFRPTRSTAIIGAAAALLVASAGWLTATAAAADDTPTPDPTTTATGAPGDTTASGAAIVPPVDPDGPSLPSPQTTLPGLHKPDTASGGLTLPRTPGTAPDITTHGDNFSKPVVPDAPSDFYRYWPLVEFDSTGATVQSGEPRALEPGRKLARTMWIKWKAPVTGYVSVAVNGGSGADTGVAVYTGSKLSNLKRVAWNDDQYSPVDGAAGSSSSPNRNAIILSLYVKAKTTYYIQVGTSVSSTATSSMGFADLTVQVVPNQYLPSNDNFRNAKELSFSQGTTASKTVTALLNGGTMESWEPSDNSDNAANVRDGSVWYKITAPQTGLLVVSACAFLSGPSVAVFGSDYAGEGAGVGYGDLRSLAFDADGSSVCPFLSGGGSVTWGVNQGATYFIQVSHTRNSIPATLVDITLQGVFAQPYIDKLSKTSGHAGTTITITGQSLNVGSMVVKFGSKTATIVGGPTASTIVVKVPSLPKGTYKVTVSNTAPNPDDVSNKVSFKVT